MEIHSKTTGVICAETNESRGIVHGGGVTGKSRDTSATYVDHTLQELFRHEEEGGKT